MDSRLRAKIREAAQSAEASASAAIVLLERMRAGEITRQQLLLAAAAGILPTACLALNTDQSQASAQCESSLPPPCHNLFQSILEQVKVIWALNNQLGWGFKAQDFLSVPVPTRWPGDEQSLIALVLVPYLETVQSTFDGLWRVIESRYASTTRASDLKSDPKHLRLLPGITHPGKCLRWEVIDLGTCPIQFDVVQTYVRDHIVSPHAGVLAAAAIHTEWMSITGYEQNIQAEEMAQIDDWLMDMPVPLSETMEEVDELVYAPAVWLPGYQMLVGKGHWGLVPLMNADEGHVYLRRYRESSLSRGMAAVPTFIPV